jgi:GNAT superfamily N-acetyltransferase
MTLPAGAELRPLRPGDRDQLVALYERLSPESSYRRFFTAVPRLDGPLLRALLDVDHDHHEALVVVVDEEIVAVADYIRSTADPDVAELAVTVDDAWHRHGLATALLAEISRLARRRGVRRFDAAILPDNRPALSLVRHMAPGASATFDAGLVDVSIATRTRTGAAA